MGLFGKSFAEHRADADAHFSAGRLGEAKLAYDHALGKARGVIESEVTSVRARIVECRDGLARRLLADAGSFAEAGEFDRAEDALAGALDVAASEAILAEIRTRADQLQHEVAAAQAHAAPVSEDDEYAGLSGTWEEEQADEYDGYGDRFRKAYLALEAGRAAEALPELQAILDAHAGDDPPPAYLHFEIGRALLGSGKAPEGIAAIRKFLEGLGPDEGGQARLRAHFELASCAIAAEDFDGAERELRAAVEAFPGDADASRELAAFLRSRKRPEEALKVLRDAAAEMGEYQLDPRLFRELGLCAADLGLLDEAQRAFETIIQQRAVRFETDFDPEVAVPLARIYEKQGDLRRAADLYRHLAAGSDKNGHGFYNLEAARLLHAAGDTAEARKHALRAQALAKSDADREAAGKILASG